MENNILQYKSGRVYCTDDAARVVLEKSVEPKSKWIRKVFKNKQEMLKYLRAKRLAQLDKGALRNQGFFLTFLIYKVPIARGVIPLYIAPLIVG